MLVSQALRDGLSRESLRSAAWEAPFYGVRAEAGSLISLEDLCAAYALKLPPGSVFAGVTAARLWGMPLPAYVGRGIREVDVSAEAPRRAPRGVGVRGRQHRLGTPTTWVGDLPLLSPEETWFSLGRSLDWVDLTAVADHLVSDGPGRRLASASLRSLEQTVERHPDAHGIVSLRRALPAVRVGSWSRTETLIRLTLVSAGIPEPELNWPLATNHRSPRLDLAWPNYRFGLEYDGDHHRSPEQFMSDIRRQERIHDEQWAVMRATRDDLFDRPSELVSRVHRRLTERGCLGIRLRMSHMVVPRR
ncbi:MAG: hypothetical protein ABUT11_04335 [Leifsonia sp.]